MLDINNSQSISDSKSTSSINTNTGNHGTSKKVYLYLGLALVLVLSIIAGFTFFFKDYFALYPIGKNNSNVDHIAFSYGFIGTIRELRDNSNGTLVVLDGNNLPEMLVHRETTKFFTVKDGKLDPIENDFSLLKVGRHVRITILYEPSTKDWTRVWQITFDE